MKLWKALKELDENPEKKFSSKFERVDADVFIEGISLKVVHQGVVVLALDVNRDWQEVKQPVTWQEALEAWVNGKTIKCTIQGSDFIFDGYKPKLRDQIDTIGRIQLREGTWYIED